MKVTVLNYRELKKEYVRKRERSERDSKSKKGPKGPLKKDTIDLYLEKVMH